MGFHLVSVERVWKDLDSVPSPAEAVDEPAVDQTRGKVWE